MRLVAFLLPLILSLRVLGKHKDDDDDSKDDTSVSASASASSSGTASAAGSTTTSLSSDTSGLTGDSQCASLMCVSAVVNGSSVEYTLQSTGSLDLGWMAIGFGTRMADAQMVIVWPNSDGSATLSQRTASGETMPTLDSSPDRVATLQSDATDVTGASSDGKPKFSFTVEANSDSSQSLIWAFSSTNPGSSSTSASMTIHNQQGSLTLDLTAPLSSSGSSSNPASSSSGSSLSSQPYTTMQKLIVAHAVLLGLGFLVFLPLGALFARYFRTFTSRWFLVHSIVQFYVAGPLIIIGFALGVAAVSQAGLEHLNDDHKRWGVAILILYLVQCTLGAGIHFIKAKPSPSREKYSGGKDSKAWLVRGIDDSGRRRRPAQNYMHAVLGLLVLGLAFYQVRSGYRDEWPLLGRGDAPEGVNVAWIVWVVILSLLYFVGLVLLPRQFKQERNSQQQIMAQLGAGAQDGRGVPVEMSMSDMPSYRNRPTPIVPPGLDTRVKGGEQLSPVSPTSRSGHGHGYGYNTAAYNANRNAYGYGHTYNESYDGNYLGKSGADVQRSGTTRTLGTSEDGHGAPTTEGGHAERDNDEVGLTESGRRRRRERERRR